MTACVGKMAKAKAWEVTDDFWSRVEPLIPVRQRPAEQSYARKVGGGRKAKDPRLVFEAIVYVLRTGCQWRALPFERYGSATACLLYTSDAADDLLCVDLGGRRIIKK